MMDYEGGSLLLSRRALLRRSALVAGFLALARLRVPSAAAARSPTSSPLRVLSATEGMIMAAIAERMVGGTGAELPRFEDTAGLTTIDWALAQVDPDVRQQLRWLLWGFQWGPPVLAFRMTTFTGMAPEAQDAYLQGWATSPSELRLLAFRALKNLSMLGYYAQASTWAPIHYDGPWLRRTAGAVATGAP